MSDSQNMSDEVRARLRAIPSVNELLAEWPVVKAAGETCDTVVHAAVTAELDEERAAIRAGAAPRSKRELALAIEWRAHRSALPSLRPAVNATGVVIHTNLGRAPLAESAAKAVAEVARGYSTLEYSVDTCSRGSRKEHAAQLIRSLTGAEDALVVNNNAAAVLLVLATHAAGKEVIEVYYGAPQGELGKAAKSLAAYEKTRTLLPDEEQRVVVSFPCANMASFDDSGKSGAAFCYVLEAGDYLIYAGTDVRSCEQIGVHTEPELRVTERLASRADCAPKEAFDRLVAATDEQGKIEKAYESVPLSTVSRREEIEKNLPEAPDFTGDKGIKLEDVANNRATLAGFTAQLEDVELEALCRGDYVMNSKLGTPGNAAVYGGILKSLRKKGVPPVSATDGPSGIRLHCYASLLPIGTLLASTWNQQLVRELYSVEGAEMARKGSDVLLAPGMNIHRDPLCGRNFEYFSEDPLLAGTMGAAVVRGIQSQGVSACPKHFACNNQETMRIYNDSRVSERALREIYLKGFEICVKTAHPFNIMTSYNKINGVWGHYHYGTCTQILRGEWEYDGCVMTDWWMRASKDPDFPLLRNNAYRVRGQVDVLMPGAGAGSRKAKYDPTLLESLGKPDGITRAEIFRSAMNTLRFVLRSHPFCAEHGLDNGYRPGPDWFECR